MPPLVKTWEFWSAVPFFGRWIFSWLVSFYAPYTGTLPFRVNTLDSSKCITNLYDWFWIRNPFSSIHAAALTNLGECTMGFAMIAWGERNGYRVIPIRLDVEFLAKARGYLTATCDLQNLANPGDSETVVTNIYNAKGELVCRVTGTWKVSPKKKELK